MRSGVDAAILVIVRQVDEYRDVFISLKTNLLQWEENDEEQVTASFED
jgi:hypothetical protein